MGFAARREEKQTLKTKPWCTNSITCTSGWESLIYEERRDKTTILLQLLNFQGISSSLNTKDEHFRMGKNFFPIQKCQSNKMLFQLHSLHSHLARERMRAVAGLRVLWAIFPSLSWKLCVGLPFSRLSMVCQLQHKNTWTLFHIPFQIETVFQWRNLKWALTLQNISPFAFEHKEVKHSEKPQTELS